MQAETHDVELARAGDAQAFERLYRGRVSRVHSLARRMAGDDVADDLTQEVFIRAWQKLDSFRGDAAFGTWLHRLAVNLILTRRERMKRRESRTVRGDEALLSGFRSRSQRPTGRPASSIWRARRRGTGPRG